MPAGNSRFGNRLAGVITISYKSISTIVPADVNNLALVLGLDIIKYQPIAMP